MRRARFTPALLILVNSFALAQTSAGADAGSAILAQWITRMNDP
jgi:hypothetical protein